MKGKTIAPRLGGVFGPLLTIWMKLNDLSHGCDVYKVGLRDTFITFRPFLLLGISLKASTNFSPSSCPTVWHCRE